MKCPRCQGRGFLYDFMLNEKECYECKGTKIKEEKENDRNK